MYFYEDKDFSISADLSPLVIGHLIAITTKHFASFGEVMDKVIPEKIKSVSISLLGNDDLIFFEHGAVIEGCGGASIDHAHLHIMPRPSDMTVETIDKYIVKSGFVTHKKEYADHSRLNRFFKEKQPYIFYEILGERYAYPVGAIPSQFLRKMMQPYSDIDYNWRVNIDNEECRVRVEKTIDYVRKNTIKPL